MKLYVDTGSKQVTVTKDPTEKLEQNGRQKTERGTGQPTVKVGQLVTVSKLEALPWATNGRNGVAFRAEEIKAASGLASVKTG